MKPITPLIHAYLDYFTVVVFLLAPFMMSMSGAASGLAYALALIHLAMTLLTDFPLSAAPIIPFRTHGLIERLVGPGLLLCPFLFSFTGSAFVFYLMMGFVIIIVTLLTDYEPNPAEQGS